MTTETKTDFEKIASVLCDGSCDGVNAVVGRVQQHTTPCNGYRFWWLRYDCHHLLTSQEDLDDYWQFNDPHYDDAMAWESCNCNGTGYIPLSSEADQLLGLLRVARELVCALVFPADGTVQVLIPVGIETFRQVVSDTLASALVKALGIE